MQYKKHKFFILFQNDQFLVILMTFPNFFLKKIKQLISYLAESVPFTPNWQNIKKITDIADDRTIKTYFKYLEDAHIIYTLGSSTKKLKKLEDPEKIFLANTNQLFALAFEQPEIGNLRETFLLSNVSTVHDIATANNADFYVDKRFLFEIGGKNKDTKQIRDQESAYLVLDNIEHGTGNRIPLWLFGFLY